MMPLGRLQHIPVCPSLPIQSVMLVDHDQAILAIPRYSLIDFHTETALDSAIASHAPAAAVHVACCSSVRDRSAHLNDEFVLRTLLQSESRSALS